jgi:cation-transporting ATPase 13A1
MFYGLVLVAGVAFSGATEFIPEMNEKLKLVPFTTDFKVTLTTVMLIDYVGCWVVEQVLKWAFSDYRPKDIAIRRPDQLKREEDRKAMELEEARLEQEAAEEARFAAVSGG